MHFSTVAIFLLASYLHATSASPTPRKASISWSRCAQAENITSSLQCATFEVPRDYTKADSDETITLNLVRLPASIQPSKGSIFMNTGGPGIAQRNNLLGESGKSFQLLTGGEYDIVTFDPRGTGETLPFSCYNTTAERTAALTGIPSTWTASNTALGFIWGSKHIQGARCLLQAPESGELIGTAFVARDIMQVVGALEKDGMVRFLGFSYGTALGTTLAAMFPNRIDKMVLDGVLNVDEYYAGRELQQVAKSDDVWVGFFKGCMEAPESLCPLKRRASSAEELQTSIDDLIDTTKYAPIPLAPYMPAGLADYNRIKSTLFAGLYYPALWPTMASMFEAVLTANATSFLETSLTLLGTFADSDTGFPSYSGPEALQGIRCSDTAFRTENVSNIVPTLQEFKDKSSIIGDAESTAVYLSCASWQMKAKEVYLGGFKNLKTKNPLLFVGSPFDPLTPLPSARNLSAAFEGSALVQHDGYGHCSISQPSLCTAKAVRAYFADGSLPDPGTICKPSVPIFRPSDKSLLSVLAPLNGTSKRDVEARNEDWQLLQALGHIGREMVKSGRPI